MFDDIFVELCASYQVHLVTKYMQLYTFDSIAERTQWKECVKGKEKEDAKSRASYDHDTMERKVGRPEDVVPGFCLMGIPRWVAWMAFPAGWGKDLFVPFFGLNWDVSPDRVWFI